MIVVNDLKQWIDCALDDVKSSKEAKSYIANVLSQHSLNDCSLVLKFCDAKASGKFHLFQEIGDYVLFVNSLFATQHRDVHLTLARLSYYSCYRILQKQWPLYEELADQLPAYTKQIKNALYEEKESEEKNKVHSWRFGNNISFYRS